MSREIHEDRFRLLAPEATAEISGHLSTDAEAKKTPWKFDHGFVFDDRSASAVFSRVSLSGRGRDMLTVRAARSESGSWTVTSSIKPAD